VLHLRIPKPQMQKRVQMKIQVKRFRTRFWHAYKVLQVPPDVSLDVWLKHLYNVLSNQIEIKVTHIAAGDATAGRQFLLRTRQ
jgi:hypothetical protein